MTEEILLAENQDQAAAHANHCNLLWDIYQKTLFCSFNLNTSHILISISFTIPFQVSWTQPYLFTFFQGCGNHTRLSKSNDSRKQKHWLHQSRQFAAHELEFLSLLEWSFLFFLWVPWKIENFYKHSHRGWERVILLGISNVMWWQCNVVPFLLFLSEEKKWCPLPVYTFLNSLSLFEFWYVLWKTFWL